MWFARWTNIFVWHWRLIIFSTEAPKWPNTHAYSTIITFKLITRYRDFQQFIRPVNHHKNSKIPPLIQYQRVRGPWRWISRILLPRSSCRRVSVVPGVHTSVVSWGHVPACEAAPPLWPRGRDTPTPYSVTQWHAVTALRLHKTALRRDPSTCHLDG